MAKTQQITEFGDFQTPGDLALEVTTLLANEVARGLRPAPRSIVEPTCGKGAFVCAAQSSFENADVFGFDVNATYIDEARRCASAKAHLAIADFFTFAWRAFIEDIAEPVLFLGNPPWVTNSQLSALNSQNLPAKSNFQSRQGLEAITGKANFDISEWMLIQLLEILRSRTGTIAMLVKTAVARKALVHAWKNGISTSQCRLFLIDAKEHFGASVDACLMVVDVGDRPSTACTVFDTLSASVPQSTLAFIDGKLVADLPSYERTKHLHGEERLKWRSGVKHDCSKVMEFSREGNQLRNGDGQIVDLEPDLLFPMLKSSAVANGNVAATDRWMLVPQTRVNEDTQPIAVRYPKTWKYLASYESRLAARGSSIYKGRPPFSVFGVGEYSFSRWKVAVSGFYKRLRFQCVGPIADRSVVFDDTCYFVACETEPAAKLLHTMLSSELATDFFNSLIFWDAKRPITVEVLRRLDLLKLADELGVGRQFATFFQLSSTPTTSNELPATLFQ